LCITGSGIITPIGGRPVHRWRDDWMECLIVIVIYYYFILF